MRTNEATIEQTRELFYLVKQHRKLSPIKSKTIEKQLKLAGSEVRKIVNQLRNDGYRIASSSRGYYFEQNVKTFQDSLAHLKHRSSVILTTYKNALKKSSRIQSIKN